MLNDGRARELRRLLPKKQHRAGDGKERDDEQLAEGLRLGSK
jgi:hypothetical protein